MDLSTPALVIACAITAGPLPGLGSALSFSATARAQLFTATTVAMAARVVSAMRGFDQLAHFVEVLVASAEAMIPLLFIVAVVVGACALIFFIQFAGAEDDDDDFAREAASLPTALLAAYKMGILGDASTAAFQRAVSPAVVHVVFVFFTIVVVIVAVNSIIAVLGDAYDHVLEGKTASRNRQRAQLMLKYWRQLPTKAVNRILEVSTWVHRLVPFAQYEEELVARSLGVKGGDREGDWHGRVAAVVREMRREHKMSERAVHRRVDALERQLVRLVVDSHRTMLREVRASSQRQLRVALDPTPTEENDLPTPPATTEAATASAAGAARSPSIPTERAAADSAPVHVRPPAPFERRATQNSLRQMPVVPPRMRPPHPSAPAAGAGNLPVVVERLPEESVLAALAQMLGMGRRQGDPTPH